MSSEAEFEFNGDLSHTRELRGANYWEYKRNVVLYIILEKLEERNSFILDEGSVQEANGHLLINVRLIHGLKNHSWSFNQEKKFPF